MGSLTPRLLRRALRHAERRAAARARAARDLRAASTSAPSGRSSSSTAASSRGRSPPPAPASRRSTRRRSSCGASSTLHPRARPPRSTPTRSAASASSRCSPTPATGRGSTAPRSIETGRATSSRANERADTISPGMSVRIASMRGRVLPNGWADLLRQFCLFGGAYLLYRLVEGLRRRPVGRGVPPRQRDDLARAHAPHLRRAGDPGAGPRSSHLLLVIAAYVYLNAQTTTDRRRAPVPLHRPQPQLLLRAQHADRRRWRSALVCYGAVPDRAAAAAAGVGLHRHQQLDHRRHRQQHGRQRVRQPVRGDPVDARRLRRDARVVAGAPRAPPRRARCSGSRGRC